MMLMCLLKTFNWLVASTKINSILHICMQPILSCVLASSVSAVFQYSYKIDSRAILNCEWCRCSPVFCLRMSYVNIYHVIFQINPFLYSEPRRQTQTEKKTITLMFGFHVFTLPKFFYKE